MREVVLRLFVRLCIASQCKDILNTVVRKVTQHKVNIVTGAVYAGEVSHRLNAVFLLDMRSYLAGGTVGTVSACTVGNAYICRLYSRKSLYRLVYRFYRECLVRRKDFKRKNSLSPGV